MTANQIAYASVQEAERHNKEMETETQLHDRETEKLTAEANDIARSKNRFTEEYNRRDLELREQYNKWYEQYQTAATDEKLSIERYLADIQKERAENDRSHQIMMDNIAYDEKEIRQKQQEEEVRHNKVLETVSETKTAYDFLLSARRQEYESTYMREQTAIAQERNAIDLMNAETKRWYDLGMLDIERRSSVASQFKDYWSGINQMRQGVMPLGLPVLPTMAGANAAKDFSLVQDGLSLFSNKPLGPLFK